jgi:signal transduction histidine kinase
VTHDQVVIIATTAAWSSGVAVVGAVLIRLGRRASVRWLTISVAMVAVVAVLAGTLATARAMFLSQHDLGVVALVASVAGAVALVFALAVGTALARWSRDLLERTRVFGDSGRFTATSATGPAELEQLSAELRRTSDRLAESRAREVALEQSRRELVSWVSHDLRTPLAGLRAMTEALEDGLADDPVRYHAQMRAEVERMVRMVDDLFELSRIHAGVMRLSPQPVALGDVVSEALASADSVARARGVRLDGAVDEGLLVTADPAGLSRVVSNLLMNAIRHTPADGVVEVQGRAVDDAVELSVTDGCGGLTQDDMARVFDVAWQGDSARTPDHVDSSLLSRPGGGGGAGAGLGLAIVKGIVEAHLGQVAVANHEPGCRFLVRLPS